MTASLRPYLPKDASALADLAEASIEILAEEDYSTDQRAAWIAQLIDDAAFATRLEKQLTLVVYSEDGPLGFASLKDNALIDMLYVHPEHARRGVATLLCEALEKLAAARKASALTAQASDTALPFFEARGYAPQQRSTVIINGEWLANTTMLKKLAPPAGAAKP